MTYGSVCSGIEAATCAWHSLGWRAAWFSEVDAFPSAVLAHHYPTVPNHGDMTKLIEGGHAESGSIDLLVGGTPCQSFSVAGLRKGLDDPRGNLALVFLAIADRARPRWVVWENVPGVLSVDGGRAFGAFLGGLAELGYGFAYRVLDAQYYGVAQRRRRVFVVGYLGDWRRAAAVLFERASLQGNPPPRREPGQRASPTLAARTRGGGGLGTDHDLDGGLIGVDFSYALNAGGQRRWDPNGETLLPILAAGASGANGAGIGKAGDPSFTLDTTGHQGVAHSLRGDGFDASEDGTGRGTPLVAVFDPNQVTCPDNRSSIVPEVSHSLLASAQPPIAFDARQSDVVTYGDKAGPLDTDGHSQAIAGTLQANSGRADAAAAGHYIPFQQSVRRLTPRECERLQGFHDDYTLTVYRGKPAADGPRYKALGNSMCVKVMRWIGERIAMVEALR